MHWGEMMVVLQCVREAYLRRFPDARNGWTVGHLERLATTVLALPTYQLMHMETANDETRLHPALSSLFRVTDGLRMTMHQMLFVPLGEATLAADAPMTGADILAYAERNYSLHSEHGVCAGPTAMIEEFLSVLVDGRAPRSSAPVELDAEVRQALEALEPAIDYALLGLQAYAVVFSLWPAMTRAYEALADIAERSAAANNPRLLYLRDRMRHHIERIRLGTYLGTEQLRTERELVYADMYAQCGAGLRDQPATRTLKQCIAPARNSRNHAAKHTLLAAARAHFGNAGHTTDTLLVALADCLSQFLLQEQAVLRAATHTQMQINRLLGRAAPKRAFSAADIDMHNLLQGVAERRLPYLINEIEALLGVQIYVDANRIEITGPAASYANETEAANAVA